MPILNTYTFLLLFCVLATCFQFDKEPFHNNQELEQQINTLLEDSRFTKQQCRQDTKIGKIIIEDSQALISVIVVCNIHAREFFASEVCLEFMKQVKNGEMQAKVNYTIFYSANTERQSAFNGDYCKRTNKNDVDLNRNYPSGFVYGNQDAETNPGSYPLSQNFSQCLDETVQKSHPTIFLDIHTGQFSIFHSVNIIPEQLEVLEKLKIICPNCMLRTNKDSEGIAFIDMHERRKIKWSTLFEVYGGNNQSLDQNNRCWVIFNPTSKPMYDFYLKRGVLMIQRFVQQVNKKEKTVSTT